MHFLVRQAVPPGGHTFPRFRKEYHLGRFRHRHSRGDSFQNLGRDRLVRNEEISGTERPRKDKCPDLGCSSLPSIRKGDNTERRMSLQKPVDLQIRFAFSIVFLEVSFFAYPKDRSEISGSQNTDTWPQLGQLRQKILLMRGPLQIQRFLFSLHTE